jgi:sterol desaturase/sphingolipid hydroxylase (fatty acid hydroxylase superfamily)
MNEEGKRPGGLTALAVINFILVGLGVISLLTTAAVFSLADRIPTEEMTETQRAQFETFQNMGTPMLIFIIGLNLLSAILLLLSGIGYLQQKKILGRMVGNIYAVTTIIASLVSGLWFAAELGGGFNIGTIISLIYPIVTLVLINTTFKDDLTN